jgi:hypothetical protein
MSATYAVVSDVGLALVTDTTTHGVAFPGAFLAESFGFVVVSGVGNADGFASVSGAGLATTTVNAVGSAAGTGAASGAAPVTITAAGHAAGVGAANAFGESDEIAIGHADGHADVITEPAGAGHGNADGAANVDGRGGHLVGLAGIAEGKANVDGRGRTLATIARDGNADGRASVDGLSGVAAIVGAADGSADVIAFQSTVKSLQANADGFASVRGGVRIPGDGCALVAGL